MYTVLTLVFIVTICQIGFGDDLKKGYPLRDIYTDEGLRYPALALRFFQVEAGKGHLLQQIDLTSTVRAFEGRINTSLECIRNRLNAGSPEFAVPSFDPLAIAEETIDFTAANVEVICGSLTVRNLVLDGVTKWQVTSLKGNIGLIPPSYTISMTVNFPRVVLNTQYEADVVVNGTNIFGAGSLKVEILNFSLKVDLKIVPRSGVQFDYFHALPSLDEVDVFEVTGLLNDEEYSSKVSAYIQENGPQIINDNAQLINQTLNELVLEGVNNGSAGDEDSFLSAILKECLL